MPTWVSDTEYRCPMRYYRPWAGADPGFFLGGGALVSCFTSTPINHIVFFLQNTSCIRKPQVISGGGGGRVRTPCTLPRDPPLPEYIRELVSLKAQGACNLRTTSGILLAMTDLFKSQLQRSEMLCRGSSAPRQTLILSSAISKPIFLRLLMTNVTISKF